jgi:hypothetical protein
LTSLTTRRTGTPPHQNSAPAHERRGVSRQARQPADREPALPEFYLSAGIAKIAPESPPPSAARDCTSRSIPEGGRVRRICTNRTSGCTSRTPWLGPSLLRSIDCEDYSAIQRRDRLDGLWREVHFVRWRLQTRLQADIEVANIGPIP